MFYCAILLIGVLLCCWGVYIHRFTIINTTVPIAIVLIVGVSVFFFNSNHYKKVFNVHGVFFPLLQNICSWGFISCYLFMAVNYYGADTEVRNVELPIKFRKWKVGIKSNRNKRYPVVIVNYFGIDKELVFAYADTKRVNAAKKVIVAVRHGSLGFDVVDHYDVAD